MSWILIFWMSGSISLWSNSVVFHSQDSCQQALNAVQTSTDGKADGICVEDKPDQMVAPAE